MGFAYIEVTMKFTILIDNLPHDELMGEWGLAVYMEHGGKKILLDAGASDGFAKNAELLGIDLKGIDFAALSHAHFDHSDGMDAFFAINKKAKLHLRSCCRENCYSEKENGPEYIGIRKGFLQEHSSRLSYVDGDFLLMPGIWLIPHKTPELDKIGKKIRMFTEENGQFLVENFAHEQSLVVETSHGLVIFNSCSHGGADNIIREVEQTFPGKKIYALVGGLHLFRSSAEEVAAFAQRVKETGIECLVTGHCTGEAAMEILKDHLGNRVVQMYSGLTIEIA